MTKIIRWSVILFILSTFLTIFPISSFAFTITDDISGGDCSTIGTWNAVTKTCTLTQDVTDSIAIESDGITLDGANHSLMTPTAGAFGIFLQANANDGGKRANITIKNLTLDGWSTGIHTNAATNTLIEQNTFINILGSGIFGSNATFVSDLVPYSITIRDNAFENVSGAISLDGDPRIIQIEENSIHAPLNGSGVFIQGGRGGIFESVVVRGNTVDSPNSDSYQGIAFDRVMSPFGIPYPCFRPTVSSSIVIGISGNTVKGFDRGVNFSTNCTDVLSTIHDNILENNKTGLNFFIPNQTGIAVVSRNDFLNNTRSILPTTLP